MRRFTRYPTSMPIQISIDNATLLSLAEICEVEMLNVSAGGLAFQVDYDVPVASTLTITIPEVWPGYSARGTVVWCRKVASGFEAGVMFTEPDEAFKARMVERFCRVEDYRSSQRAQGRWLSSEDAAREWMIQFS